MGEGVEQTPKLLKSRICNFSPFPCSTIDLHENEEDCGGGTGAGMEEPALQLKVHRLLFNNVEI